MVNAGCGMAESQDSGNVSKRGGIGCDEAAVRGSKCLCLGLLLGRSREAGHGRDGEVAIDPGGGRRNGDGIADGLTHRLITFLGAAIQDHCAPQARELF